MIRVQTVCPSVSKCLSPDGTSSPDRKLLSSPWMKSIWLATVWERMWLDLQEAISEDGGKWAALLVWRRQTHASNRIYQSLLVFTFSERQWRKMQYHHLTTDHDNQLICCHESVEWASEDLNMIQSETSHSELLSCVEIDLHSPPTSDEKLNESHTCCCSSP